MAANMVITAATARIKRLLHKIFSLLPFVAAASMGVSGIGPVAAADVRLTPRIAVQQLYTSNAQAGNSAGDAITTATPGLLITTRSRLMDLSLDYSLQDNYYAVRETNRLFHLADVNGHFTLLRDLLFLDASLANSQQNISNSGQNGYDNLTLSGDTSNVLRYSIDPAVHYQFGNLADVELKYSTGGIQTERDDSESSRYLLSMKNGAAFNRLLWDLSFNSDRQDYQSDATVVLENVTGRFRYLLGRSLALVTSGGYDSNRYSSVSEVDGPLWNVGVEWNPSVRTSLLLLYGRRYFGTDLNVKATHRMRRLMLSIGYSIEPETTRNILTEQQVFSNTDPLGNIVTGLDAAVPGDISVGAPIQTNEVFIQKRLNLVLGVTLNHQRVMFEFTDTDREYEVSGRNETLRQAGLSWNIEFSRKTSTELSCRWIDSMTMSDLGEEYLISNGEIHYLLGENFLIKGGISYMIRNSSTPLSEYDEARVYAGFSKAF